MPQSTTAFETVEVLSNGGRLTYAVDNTGDTDVSATLQNIFDDIAKVEQASATITFAPGVYYINTPLTVRLASIRLQGHGHGGLDIHGANMSGGSILRFGPQCGPNCITFENAGHSKAFPSGESPWDRKSLRLDIDKITFMGHNNTDVDTASGYSRFRGDEPNFRGLKWYPAKGRYNDVEAEGQKAIYIPSGGKNSKIELLNINGCHFTDLYVGVDVASCDVSHITNCWFAQMVYGVRYHNQGQGTFICNTLFADLETALKLAHPTMSAIHNNTFAYVSKCFDIGKMGYSSITGNTLLNWELSTGSAAHGAFCYIGGPSQNITITGNSLQHQVDSRAKTRTIDNEPNGRSFIHFENCDRLNFANNVIDTIQTQTVVRLHNCRESVIVDNIIKHGNGGSAVAQTGTSKNNFYRPIIPNESAAFDAFID